MSNRLKGRPGGMQLVEITPVIVGGDPIDPKNKTWLTRTQHFDAVRYWNRVIGEIRKAGKVTANDSKTPNKNAR